jgi:hypothetical protein
VIVLNSKLARSDLVSYPDIPGEDSNGIGQDGLLQQYYDWLLCGEPKYNGFPTEPLFCHGTISYGYDPNKGFIVNEPINIRANVEGNSLDLSERITTKTLVVIDILSSFFFPGDVMENGDTIRTRRECYLECSNDYIYEGGSFATIRRINQGEKEAGDIYVIHVGPVAINVEVDPVNPYLDKFAGSPQRLSPGPKVGYASSYMSFFRIKNPGEYIIEYGGDGKPPYHSQACLQVIVSRDESATLLGNLIKPRKLPLKGKLLPH